MKRERKLINVSQEGITCLWFVVLLSVGVLLGSNPAYAQPFAYVTNVGTGDVSVIDTATNQVIDVDPTTPALDNIPVGDGPFAVAITPDGAFAYVANSESNTVSVIDTATNTVIDVDPTTPALDNIPVGGEPVGVAITPDGAFVYVANTFGGTVSVIDTATNQVIDVDPTTPALDNIPVGGEPLGVAITPNGAFVYVAIPDTVSVIDTATNQVIDVDPTTPALDNIPVGSFPVIVAITPLLDSDDDGIPDAVDNCPGTPAGETVDANGCTQEQATQNQIDVLQDIVADPSTDPELAEEVEDVIPSLQTALVELNKTPPDNQAAVGNIEGAVGDLEATIGLDPAQDPVLTDLMNQLAGVAQQLAVDAIAEAIAQGGDSGEISDAQVSLMEGDALRASEAFKDAVNKYKDALAKAESAIS